MLSEVVRQLAVHYEMLRVSNGAGGGVGAGAGMGYGYADEIPDLYSCLSSGVGGIEGGSRSAKIRELLDGASRGGAGGMGMGAVGTRSDLLEKATIVSNKWASSGLDL
jgi:hypothetical protein